MSAASWLPLGEAKGAPRRTCTGGFASGVFPQLAMNLVLVKGLYVCSLTSTFPPNEEADLSKRDTLLQWAQDNGCP